MGGSVRIVAVRVMEMAERSAGDGRGHAVRTEMVSSTAAARLLTVRTWFHGTHPSRYCRHVSTAPGLVGSRSPKARLRGWW